MTTTVLITGITGFVGSHMADFILEQDGDYEIWGVKRWHLSRPDHVLHLQDSVNWVDCNMTDAASVREVIERVRPDIVFHFASESFVSPSWRHPSHYMDINYGMTVNLLEAVRHVVPDCRVHLPGSGEGYGDVAEADLPIVEETVLRPVNPYAVTKIAQDLIGYVYFRSYGTKVIRTRAFNHEGPRRDKVFGIPGYAYQVACVEAGKQEPLLKVGHIDDRRNFTHVVDMVRAYWVAVDKCEPGELYQVGSEGDEVVYSFREALERLIGMSTVAGIRYEIDPQYVRPTNVPRLICDASKFRAATGWQPTISFQQILEDTLTYWRERV